MSNPPPTPPDPWRSGTVTRSDAPWPSALAPMAASAPAPALKPAGSDRRTLLWFGGVAGAIAVVGLVVLLAVVLTGEHKPLRPRYAAPPDLRPPLARLCPPPSEPPAGGLPSAVPPPSAVPVPPAGLRTTDRDAGVSYRRYSEPWLSWQTRWSAGTLEVLYAVGQHFVTEVYPRGNYHASILSGRVPAAVNDAVTIDLECTGRQVAADVRASYYPQPNRMEMVRDERRVLGGLPAWVTVFRLHFTARGLTATSELVGVALIDVGRPDAAVVYVSIPNTHTALDWVVEDVLASVRPAR